MSNIFNLIQKDIDKISLEIARKLDSNSWSSEEEKGEFISVQIESILKKVLEFDRRRIEDTILVLMNDFEKDEKMEYECYCLEKLREGLQEIHKKEEEQWKKKNQTILNQPEKILKNI